MFGKVKRLSDMGYGFLVPDGENKDVFFHAKNLDGVTFDDLREGDAVQFEITQGDKGPKAIGVSLVA